MPDPVVAPPAATVPVAPPVAPAIPVVATVTAADLMKRASLAPIVLSPVPATDLRATANLDDIKDPVARAVVEKRLVEMERGLNTKFQSLAEERRVLEADRTRSNTWTPQRVLEASKDPNFVAAAQEALKTQAPTSFEGTTEQWSVLTPAEKTAFAMVEKTSRDTQSQLQQMLHAQAHEKVRTRFPDYDPAVVDRSMQTIIDGKLSPEAINEFVWKAANFDRYVEQSYQFGLTDRNGSLQEKIAGSSPRTTLTVQSNESGVTPVAGERSKAYFVRIAEERLRQQKLGVR